MRTIELTNGYGNLLTCTYIRICMKVVPSRDLPKNGKTHPVSDPQDTVKGSCSGSYPARNNRFWNCEGPKLKPDNPLLP